ncbi:hypothetical protein SAMN04488135_11341 [Pollutimonas bauzanensis]|uniref:Uncharacterized protein n=1 Tax=Pollutimonas bauzanensis TaxID=658167 RepID=A0A1M5Z941_9BURK|nr:hypothetical protein SAMN04488135_11341 [Pollutimonas bauzanensis]
MAKRRFRPGIAISALIVKISAKNRFLANFRAVSASFYGLAAVSAFSKLCISLVHPKKVSIL